MTSRLGTKVVIVRSGSEGNRSAIHTDLVCKTSEYFRRATKPEWTADQEDCIPFDDVASEIVELYIAWLYQRRLFITEQGKSDEKVRSPLEDLINAYVFGERIQDTRFQDDVISALISQTNDEDEEGLRFFPGGASIKCAYDGTPQSSPLRKLLVDMHVVHGSDKWIKQEDIPDFHRELARELLRRRQAPSESINDHVYFHHDGDAKRQQD